MKFSVSPFVKTKKNSFIGALLYKGIECSAQFSKGIIICRRRENCTGKIDLAAYTILKKVRTSMFKLCEKM